MRTSEASRTSHLKVLVLAILALLLGVLAPSSLASEPSEEEAVDPESLRRGALTFHNHCATCHGPEGRGDGPVASELKQAPPDLTRIAERAGGRFFATQVRRKLDGRDPLASHGPSEMPVWGLTFELRGERSEEVERRLDDLVEFLRSWQKAKEPSS